jgi:GxxExxY protein
MIYESLTYDIIGCAYKVYNTLGFGFLESIYKNALIVELTKAGLHFDVEKPMQVYYEGKIIGHFYIDLLVEDKIVIELKAVKMIAKEHEVQLVNYLSGLKLDHGLLINFSPGGVEVKRKFRKPV